jgi:hypothetical protein
MPIMMGKIAKSLDENGQSVTKAAGGFKLSLGVNLLF